MMRLVSTKHVDWCCLCTLLWEHSESANLGRGASGSLLWWLPKFNGGFLVQRYNISAKIFTKIPSVCPEIRKCGEMSKKPSTSFLNPKTESLLPYLHLCTVVKIFMRTRSVGLHFTNAAQHITPLAEVIVTYINWYCVYCSYSSVWHAFV